MGHGVQQSLKKSEPWTSKRHGRSQILLPWLVMTLVIGLVLMRYMLVETRLPGLTRNVTELDDPAMIWNKASSIFSSNMHNLKAMCYP
jgi:hypothetical protein